MPCNKKLGKNEHLGFVSNKCLQLFWGIWCLKSRREKKGWYFQIYNGDPVDNAESVIVFGRIPTLDQVYSHVVIAGRQ